MYKEKAVKKNYWKRRNIKFTDEEFEFIWGVYKNIDECMLCSKHLIGFDKCLDHNHSTGGIRYILCQTCNKGYDRKVNSNNKLKEKYIYEVTNGGIDYYQIQINKKRKCLSKKKYTLDQVIEIRDKLLNL